MDQEKDKLKIVQEYADKQELNPNVVSDAKNLVAEVYGKKQKKRANFWRVLFPSFCACFVAIITVTTVLLWPRNNEINYYYEADTYPLDIPILSEFVDESNLGIVYFDMAGKISEKIDAHYTREGDKLAYVLQKTTCIDGSGISSLELGIVLIEAGFEVFRTYQDIDAQLSYGDTLTVFYQTTQSNERYVTLAKFDIGSTHYYLKITSFLEDSLTYYLDQLLA